MLAPIRVSFNVGHCMSKTHSPLSNVNPSSTTAAFVPPNYGNITPTTHQAPIGNGMDTFGNDGTEDSFRDNREAQLGPNESTTGYFRVVIMTLISSFIWYFLSFVIRGVIGLALFSLMGIFMVRVALASLFYGETRGSLDPFQTIAAMAAGSIHYGFGIAMFITQIGAGWLAVLAAGSIPTIISYGGPVINPSLSATLTGGQVTYVEFIFTFFAIFSYMASYSWKNYWNTVGSNPNTRRGIKSGSYMYYDFHPVSLISPAMYAIGHGILLGITGGALDFFAFLWPAILSGILVDYPLWWGYFVGDSVGLIVGILVSWPLQYLLNRYHKGNNGDNKPVM